MLPYGLGIAPVSLSSCRSADILSFPEVISVSISVSVGMNCSPLSLVYLGIAHVLPMYL